MITEQFLRVISGVIIGIWIARHLGPDNFGTLSYILSISLFFNCIAKFGLEGFLVRELVNAPLSTHSILGTAFWLKATAASAASVCAAIPTFFLNIPPIEKCGIILVSVGSLFQCFDTIEYYFQSRVQAKIASICKIIQLSISAILKIALLALDAGVLAFVIVALLDLVSLGLAHFFAYNKFGDKSFYRHFDRKLALQFTKHAWPLFLTSLVVTLYTRADQILIRYILSESDVGQYAAATRISEALHFIPAIICTSIFPALIECRIQSNKIYLANIEKLYSAMIWMGLTSALLLSTFSDLIISTLYGNSYRQAAELLPILAWANIFVFIGIPFGKHLLVENMTKYTLIRTSIGAVLNISLNCILLPIIGLYGAAAASLIAQGCTNYGIDALNPKMRHQFKLKSTALLYPLFVKFNHLRHTRGS